MQLLDGLSRLLLVTGVDYSSRASGAALTRIDLRVGAVVLIMLLDCGFLGFLVGEFFDTRVGHGGVCKSINCLCPTSLWPSETFWNLGGVEGERPCENSLTSIFVFFLVKEYLYKSRRKPDYFVSFLKIK